MQKTKKVVVGADGSENENENEDDGASERMSVGSFHIEW